MPTNDTNTSSSNQPGDTAVPSFTPWKSEEQWQRELAAIEAEFRRMNYLEPALLGTLDTLRKTDCENRIRQHEVSRIYERSGVTKEDSEWHLKSAFVRLEMGQEGVSEEKLTSTLGPSLPCEITVLSKDLWLAGLNYLAGIGRLGSASSELDIAPFKSEVKDDALDLNGNQSDVDRFKRISTQLNASTKPCEV
ncbi:uncharacterized protein I206_106362 [Kwoniella pini CBS 10737]|uniref:Uncharacterized protein n=1 Tax=Kwoniella pini CBS 10737 TaxID=1296096 RepID=A0A1B9HU27_9TREE|nr:uncharacterized protein I206_07164 [Kwoniella pini CBS 10737]OCF46777.1 hypothetical protein I206_07164 [Kwoniella pini CBS 10737]